MYITCSQVKGHGCYPGCYIGVGVGVGDVLGDILEWERLIVWNFWRGMISHTEDCG